MELKITEILYKIYFCIQKVIVPNLRYSQFLYEDILMENVNENTIWLDLGCGHQILPVWRSEEEKTLSKSAMMLVGMDSDINSLKVHKTINNKVGGDIEKLPFKDEVFNLVTSNMVVEHLKYPFVQFKEINRILKPGGIFIFHTPNKYGYTTLMNRMVPEAFKSKLAYIIEGRKEHDTYKTYYRANDKNTITDLAKNTGFNIHKIKFIVSSARFIIIPPLVIVELMFIRLLMSNFLKEVRTNLIVILKKET